MTATVDVCGVVIYLDDVIKALRRHGISVETGFVSAVRRAGRRLIVRLGTGPGVLSGATLAWQPIVGWSLTCGLPRPRHWVLPLDIQAQPDHVATSIHDLATSLTSSR